MGRVFSARATAFSSVRQCRLPAQDGVWPLVIAEYDPAADGGFGLRSGYPSVQVDAFGFQGPPEALDEDVVDALPFAVHGDPGAGPPQAVGPGEGCKL